MNNKIFLDNYELINKIGSGSFGEVYMAKNKSDNKIYAAKIEETKNKNRLKSEYNIYKKINKDNKIIGIPKIYNFIQTSDYNIMVMELLGSSLESIYEKNKPENFSYDGVFYGDISRYDSIEYKIIKICKQYRSLELFCEEFKRFAVSDTTGFIDISLEDYSRISPNTEE